MAVNTANEKKYLESLAAKGGGSATWANAQAKKYGITLGQIPQATQTANTANTSNTGMSATQTKTPQAYSIPAYGSNISNFDANNADHIKLADAGQAYATAKMKGDTAGMSAAAALGQSLRAQNGQDEVFDAKKGITTFQTPQPVIPQAAPAASDPYGQLTPTQINNEAAAQLARERAALQTAANKRLADLRSGFEYSNKLLQDNRTLENAQMDRTLNPFSGRTSYDKAMVNRGRGIDDNNRAAQFNAEVSAVGEDLYNFDKLSEERKAQVLNELTRLERQYGLDVSDRTGTLNGQRTLQGQAFDWQRNMDTADRTGYLGGQRTLQGVQLDRSMFESDREFDFRKGQQEWENMFTQKQFDEGKAARLWEQAFKDKSFAQDVKEAAASRGLQWASLGQRDKEFIADQAFREKQFKLEKEKFEFDKNKPASSGAASYDQVPGWGDEIGELSKDPAGYYKDLLAYPQDYIATYGDKGYEELKKRAKALIDQ